MTSTTVPNIQPPPFLMNDQIPCSKGDHRWLPWIQPGPSIWRTICSVCRLSCSYVQGEWEFSQR